MLEARRALADSPGYGSIERAIDQADQCWRSLMALLVWPQPVVSLDEIYEQVRGLLVVLREPGRGIIPEEEIPFLRANNGTFMLITGRLHAPMDWAGANRIVTYIEGSFDPIERLIRARLGI